MFLDTLNFRIENFFENGVSEIHKKNQFCPYKPPKIRNAFMAIQFVGEYFVSKFHVQSFNGFGVLMCLINCSQELTREVHKTKYLVSIWVSSKTGMTFNVLQEISKQKYVMNRLKHIIYMWENINISCKWFQKMFIYGFLWTNLKISFTTRI